jgi:hypothetical protein
LLRRLFLTAVLVTALAGAVRAFAAEPVPVVRFGYDSEASRTAAEDCAEIWTREGPGLAAALLPAGSRVDTVDCLVVGTAEFARLFARLTPDWGVGVTAAGGRLVAIDRERLPAVGRGVGQVFMHEMVHALMLQTAGGVWMPSWFVEGAAQRWSGEWRFVDTVSLVFDGRVPDLGTLQHPFPADPHRADRAYRTSLLAVGRLEDRHGPGATARVLAETAARGAFSDGFLAATGETHGEFAREFDARMRLRFGWLAVITSWPTLFVIMAVVMGVAGTRHLLAARRRLAEMDDDEPGPLAGGDDHHAA